MNSAANALLGISFDSRAISLLLKAMSLLPPDEQEELRAVVEEVMSSVSESTRAELIRLSVRPK
jgi:hypothetical protein